MRVAYIALERKNAWATVIFYLLYLVTILRNASLSLLSKMQKMQPDAIKVNICFALLIGRHGSAQITIDDHFQRCVSSIIKYRMALGTPILVYYFQS